MKRNSKFDSVFRKFVLAFCGIIACFLCCNAFADATYILWSSAGGSAWLTGGNWTGGSAPTSSQIAEFGLNPTSGATGVGINMNGSTNNGSNSQAVGAIYVDSNRIAPLIIGNSSTVANGTLTLSGVTVNAINDVILRNNSTQLLTIQKTQGSGNKLMDVALGDATDNIINIDGTGGITISSVIKNGSGGHLTLAGTGTGTLVLSGANTYTGGTTIIGRTLQLSGSGTLGSTTGDLTINGGILDLNGTNQTVGVLGGTSAGTVKNTSATGSTFTIGNGNGTGSFAGSITNIGSISVTKTGTGTQTLTNNNSYTGATNVNAGTLKLANTTVALSGTSGVNVKNGATLLMGGNNQINQATLPPITLGSASGSGMAKLDAGGFSQGTGGSPLIPSSGTVGLGSLSLDASSIVDLSGTSVVHFSNSSANIWTGRLFIYDWTGSPIGGGAEQILFGNNLLGLSATQLLDVSFYSDQGSTLLANSALILADGEIIPNPASVPEPENWFAGMLAFATLAFAQRKRLRAKLG